MLKLDYLDVFIMIYLKIFVIVDLLFVDKIGAMVFKVKPLEIGTKGTIPCGHIENDLEVRIGHWYKSTRIDDVENGDPIAWWPENETGSLPNYHMENNTLSLVIGEAMLEDEGLYKCVMIRGDLFTKSNYYTRTVMYALPQMDPKITLDTDLNRVKCTVEHVHPLVYPVFDIDDSHACNETYAVLNEDGTYTTSVSCKLPHDKIVPRVDCSFFYLDYRRKGSLDLLDITTDSLVESKTTTVSPMVTSVTLAGDGCRTTYLKEIIGPMICIGLTAITFIIIIILMKLRRKCHQGVQNSNKSEESQEKMIQPVVETVAEVIT